MIETGSRFLTPLFRGIVSGGQTGVDRAALDWATHNSIAHSGWCPKGRRAEDGILDARYLLRETDSSGYAQRTRLNIQDSGGTLIMNIGLLDGGSAKTLDLALRLGKPHWVVQMDNPDLSTSVESSVDWLRRNSMSSVNIAGPRQSKRRGAYSQAYEFLDLLARHWR